MIFVDSNVPMYLVGRSHPNRDSVEAFLRSHVDETYVTSAEVFQEVIHRFVAIDRRAAIDDCFALLDELVSQVFTVTRSDVDRARQISHQQHRLSGRDCLHVAVMARHDVERILTYDEDFDYWASVTRLP